MREDFTALRIVVLMIALFVLVPLAIVVAVSFTPADFLKLPEGRLSVKWYKAIFSQPEFITAFWRSVVLALASAGMSTILGTLATFALIRYPFKGSNLLDVLLMFPLIVPQVVIGLCLLQYLNNLGISQSLPGLVIAHTVLCFPFIVRIVGTSLRGVNVNLEHAARNLGASWSQSLFHVTLPLIKPGLMIAFGFAFLSSFDNLTVSLFVAGPYYVTLPVKLYLHIDYANDPLIASISTILIFIAIAFVFLFERKGGLRRVF